MGFHEVVDMVEVPGPNKLGTVCVVLRCDGKGTCVIDDVLRIVDGT